MRALRFVALPIAMLVLAAAPLLAQNCAQTSVGKVPLSDLGAGTYMGFEGGLYPGGQNTRPVLHGMRGRAEADLVVPRDAAGNPAPNGWIVFLSIGMSNCSQEFTRLVAMASADPDKSPRVRLVNGAQGGQTAQAIANPNANFWTVVDQRLAQSGVTPAQVQTIWFKEANAGPTQGFPAHALTLQSQFTAIMQIIRDRYPNARLCYMASRIYAGYATTSLNPEPYAYEQAFAVKWTIADQIAGNPALNFDPALGAVEAPWLAWGTYNWADGTMPRGDGLTWSCSDLSADGTHPSTQGADKVAALTLAFLHTDPTARKWYLPDPRWRGRSPVQHP